MYYSAYPNNSGYPNQIPVNNNYPYQNKNAFEWVQGEAGARGYMVPAGATAWLMDSESQTFYIKSTDVNGIPQPLRIFDFKERVAISHNGPNGPVPENNYVTKDEMKAYIAEILKEKNDESSVQSESTAVTVSGLPKSTN
jgi:hypothetical protein